MKATKETNTAAIMMLQKLNDKINTLEERTSRDRDEGEVEQFIFDSWLIELQLMKDNKDALENMIIEQEFNI